MSLYDWTTARVLRRDDTPFYSLIMAAMLKADPRNAAILREAFPEVWAEVQARYNSRLALHGLPGALPEDMPSEGT